MLSFRSDRIPQRYVSHSAAIPVMTTPSDQEPIAGLFEMGHTSPPWALGDANGLGLRVSHVSMAIVQRTCRSSHQLSRYFACGWFS